MSQNTKKRSSLDDLVVIKKKIKYEDEKSQVQDINPLLEIAQRNANEDLVEEIISSEIESDDSQSQYTESDSDSDTSTETTVSAMMLNLAKEKPEMHLNLKNVQIELAKTEPNAKILFELPLLLEDRCKLCQIYEIYKNLEPNTPEWLEIRKQYNIRLLDCIANYNQYTKYTQDERLAMKAQEKLIGNQIQVSDIRYRILNLPTTIQNKTIIFRRYEDFLSLEKISEEHSKLKHWLNWAINMPYDTIKDIPTENSTELISKAANILDKELYGMLEIKEQILLFLSSRLSNSSTRRSNLGLVGPPGVGKTAIARLIAKIMNWGFEQISFGGVNKADFLKGHEYTYIGAQPGAIAKCLRRMGHKNGIIFLDELEKIATEPAIRAALLHLVDPSQNFDFKDNFLGDISIDLSHVWFIASMNSIPKDNAFSDRWLILDVKGYSLQDKVKIVRKYLLPKALKNAGRQKEDISIDIEDCKYLIQRISKPQDKGVRVIERIIQNVISKLIFLVSHHNSIAKLPFKLTLSKIKSKLSYPIKLNKKLIKILVRAKDVSNILEKLYL